MSHELRTPLNAIIGFSEIMEAAMFGPLGAEKYSEYSRDIRESGQYLLEVINDILDMSKIEAGGIRLAPEEVDLDPVLADCLRVVWQRANEKHLKLESHIDPAIHFKADRRAVKQIALNLLSNAVKFTPDGGAVTVRGHMRGGKVTIAIDDNGIGIPKDALHKLGRPFEQVESQLTKRHQGSGLGLAIAKSLTELHGGAMRICSRLGKGTTVVVRLPIEARSRRSADIEADAKRRPKAPSPKSARNIRAPGAEFPRHGPRAPESPAGRRRAPTARARRRWPFSGRTCRAGRGGASA